VVKEVKLKKAKRKNLQDPNQSTDGKEQEKAEENKIQT
jgi:hypothetical protein